MKRLLILFTLAAALSFAVAGVIVAQWHGQRAASVDAPSAAVQSRVGHPIYDLDPRDDRAMAAYATDIFIGRVLSQTGDAGAPTSAPGQELPQSQFGVEVLQMVKGEAAGVVTINQVGGLDAEAGQTMLLDGDVLLLQGQIELFLVVRVPEREWYQIVAASHGHLPADDPIARVALIDRFTEALLTTPMEGRFSRDRPNGERS